MAANTNLISYTFNIFMGDEKGTATKVVGESVPRLNETHHACLKDVFDFGLLGDEGILLFSLQ